MLVTRVDSNHTQAAEANRQSLSAFVVDRLVEVAQVVRLEGYVAAFYAAEYSRRDAIAARLAAGGARCAFELIT